MARECSFLRTHRLRASIPGIAKVHEPQLLHIDGVELLRQASAAVELDCAQRQAHVAPCSATDDLLALRQ